MARDITRHLREGVDAWQRARDLAARGKAARAGLAYQRGANALLLYRTLLRRSEADDGRPRGAEGDAALFALGALTREGVPLMARARAPRFASLHARAGLAAAHLADPSGGAPEAVAATLAVAPEPLPRLAPEREPPVGAAERIVGAASSRLLMAGLTADHPAVLARERHRWPVADEEPLPFARERRRFRGALLPGCAGLGQRAEAGRLAREGARTHRELRRALPAHAAELERVERELATILSRLGEE
ncbi:hypothetical protein SAMN06297387_105144 [Streptomyces zhaozhouensis]|uniref:Uncharacterized protein n=1 Tax=Streptomyces zhaozhouensis TaxID=1300267 RepID=A0A286DUK4_9ACTN|nr:hypothetical protein [Streptomyces zhaozhouensis]SOD62328.1 hypothetical protein SAMN06297387_105144 [Streptomyces zhaozhouensis]